MLDAAQTPAAPVNIPPRSWPWVLGSAGLLMVAAAVLAAVLFRDVRRWSIAAKSLPEPVVIELEKGEGLSRFAQELKERRIISSKWRFVLFVRAERAYRRFQAGSYRFEGTVSPLGVVRTIQQGKVYRPIVLQFSIPEGFTAAQIVERLAANGVASVEQLTRTLKDPIWLSAQRVPAAYAEGYLFPATYSFYEAPAAEQVLAQMVAVFWQNLPKDYEVRAREKGLSLHAAVTFASLIERETAHEDERPKVAEVIWRRLRVGMPLGIDAAVIYGIKDYRGDLTFAHLHDAANRYNTRIHRGLPPGPICSPSLSALAAVLNPTDAGYLYYALDVEQDKRHSFSKSALEHSRTVRKLVRGAKGTARRSR